MQFGLLIATVLSKQAVQDILEQTWHLWLIPVILVSLEAEIRRIKVQDQSRQIVLETSISKITRTK
jgi:cytochrome c-type biogenesis protein CcmH/NrfF